MHVREFTYSSCRLENDIWIKTAESIFRSTLQPTTEVQLRMIAVGPSSSVGGELVSGFLLLMFSYVF